MLGSSRRRIKKHGVDNARLDCSAKNVGFTRQDHETGELSNSHILLTLVKVSGHEVNLCNLNSVSQFQLSDGTLECPAVADHAIYFPHEIKSDSLCYSTTGNIP